MTEPNVPPDRPPPDPPARAPRAASPARSWGVGGVADTVYGLGLIGALVYYWEAATSFWDHVLAVLKSLVWPAFLVYDALRSLNG